uniref:TATA element modulatory factor 1 TATA binding domain-containing protein n=1 Tax=Glossina palpalis gambiensis TaxID=67801 RepID=A0A1B0B779_9MUSC
MSWFDTKGLASLAKTALKEAQKKIDKVLDIQEDELEGIDRSISTLQTDYISQDSQSRRLVSDQMTLAASNLESSAITEKESSGMSALSNSCFSPELFLVDKRPHEMITTPPKAGEIVKEIAALTPPLSLNSKSTKEDVNKGRYPGEVLSFPEILLYSEDTAATPESVEMISPDCDGAIVPSSVGESIVVISTSSDGYVDIENEPINQLNELIPSNESKYKVLINAINETEDLTLRGANKNQPISPQKNPFELQTIDSDSTQSFEDVQPQFADSSEARTNQSKEPSSRSDTSPNNSNDEGETATSSDIEIISSPNGDASSTNSNMTRQSSTKLKKSESVNLRSSVPAVSARSNVNRKGHCRESSEISILSIDSQSEDELEKLINRISELNSIVEARELRLLESERQNSMLRERNVELQSLVDVNSLQTSEDYTKRMSSLEKKFQAGIRERETLHSQIKELQTKIPKNDLIQALSESQIMTTELKQEGEKLSKEILQQSNIIKKLRSKEKVTNIQLKTFSDQLTIANDEVERLKRTLAAKEDVERTQIEAVHKMVSENQKLEKENAHLNSKLDDVTQKLNTLQKSFDAVKAELQQRSKQHTDFTKTAEAVQMAEREKQVIQMANQELQQQLQELREKLRLSEQAAIKREQHLREENRHLMTRLEAAELRAESSTQEISQTTIPLMRHLESLQYTLNQRTNNWNKEEKSLLAKVENSQSRLKALENIEKISNEKADLLKSRCQDLEEQLTHAIMQEEKTKIALQFELKQAESKYNKEIAEINEELELSQGKIKSLEENQTNLQQKLKEMESKLNNAQEYLEREESSTALSEYARQHLNDVAPRPQSPAISAGINSLEDAMLNSVDWHQDDLECISNPGRPSTMPGLGLALLNHNASTWEHLQSLLKQRDGELAQLQWQLSRLQAERSLLQVEISQLTLELENIKEKMHSYQILESNFIELQTSYDALLQMYGEKVERTEELELDLKECKEAYKIQIQELLAKLKT